MIKRVAKILSIGLIFIAMIAVAYGGLGYHDAIKASTDFAERANRLIDEGQGPASLGENRINELLLVQDPEFFEHGGVDLATPGAGFSTLTQSLSKRLGFDDFRPGYRKLRQTGFALGLERQLTKEQILTLFLDTVEMGRGPNGWMTGFHKASKDIYGRRPSTLNNEEFYSLVAVMIAPGRFDLRAPDEAFQERIARVDRRITGTCAPTGLTDVWLEGCASDS